MTSPTARTLARCRELGWTAAVTEKWNPHAKVRQDLFGCVDVLALIVRVEDDYIRLYGSGCLGIQACAGASAAARMDKAIAEPRLRTWLACGNQFEVWAWRKAGPRGKRKVWDVRIIPIVLLADGSVGVKETDKEAM